MKSTEKRDSLYRAARTALNKVKSEELFQYKDDEKTDVDYEATVLVMQSVASVALDLMSEVDGAPVNENGNGQNRTGNYPRRGNR